MDQMKVQLDEDGLNLWQAAMRNALSLEATGHGIPGYIDMFPEAIRLIAENLDVIEVVVSIAESYVILDANRVLSVSTLDYVVERHPTLWFLDVRPTTLRGVRYCPVKCTASECEKCRVSRQSDDPDRACSILGGANARFWPLRRARQSSDR